MLTPNPPPRRSSYVLRLWEEHGASPPWRFTLVHLASGAQQGFGSLASLMAFLEQEVGQAASINPQP